MKIKPELIDNRTGKRYRIFKNPTILGRHHSCEICIPVVEISRRHCKFYEENEEYYVEDLKSVNGTFVNEQAVFGRVKLEDGVHVKVSKCAKFPGGAKDFVFRHPKPKVESERGPEAAQVKLSESEKKDVGEIVPRTRVPLKHCVFKAARKTVLGAEAKTRIPLVKFGGKEVHFLASAPYRPGESLSFTIEHPLFEPPVLMSLRVVRVLALKGQGAQIFRVETQVAKFGEKDQERFKKGIEITPLVKYNFLLGRADGGESPAAGSAGPAGSDEPTGSGSGEEA